ncbi:hypothetical protein D5066_20500 [Enterobacter chuandaensis]|nr:hypothetical protein D5066_20500 [Enterobacter chuandaensis]
MGSCAAPSAKGDDKFITTDYLQQCQKTLTISLNGSLKLLNYFKGMLPCVINGKFRVTSYGNVNILSANTFADNKLNASG